MADQSDVENVLLSIVAPVVYPNGQAQPSIVATKTTLTANAAIGATSVAVASYAGMAPGKFITFYGGTLERVKIAASYDPNAPSLTIPLAAPLAHAHASASQVTVFDGVRIYRGWPIAAQLNDDLFAGLSHVSIYSLPNTEHNTTRYPRDEIEVAAPVHTLTAAVAGNVITLGGAVAVPQNVIALCGTKHAYPYAVQQNDTLATIATGLAALIAVDFPGTAAAGSALTVAGSPGVIQARIASSGLIYTEQGRQEKAFMVTCWCPTPAVRDLLAKTIDLALRQLDFITMPDAGAANMKYLRSTESDDGEKVQLFRRDIVYIIEFAAATVTPAYEVGVLGITEQNGPAGGAPPNTNYY